MDFSSARAPETRAAARTPASMRRRVPSMALFPWLLSRVPARRCQSMHYGFGGSAAFSQVPASPQSPTAVRRAVMNDIASAFVIAVKLIAHWDAELVGIVLLS